MHLTILAWYKQDDNAGKDIMDGLLDEGLGLMALGMGAVFLFLVVLIFATTIMSRLINHLFPDTPAVLPVSSNRSVAQASSKAGVDVKMVAVITAAIHQHRNNKNSN